MGKPKTVVTFVSSTLRSAFGNLRACGTRTGWYWQRNTKNSDKIYLVTTSSTANPTFTGPGIETRHQLCTLYCAQRGTKTGFCPSTSSSSVSITPSMLSTQNSLISNAIQGDSRGKFKISVYATIGHCETESSYVHTSNFEWLPQLELTLSTNVIK